MLRHLLMVCWLLGAAPGSVWAQLTHALRMELPADPDESEAFDVAPLGEQGVLVTTRTGGLSDNGPVRLRFQKFGTNLKLLWRTDWRISDLFRPVATYQTDRYVYHLFRDSGTDQFRFVRLHLDDGVTETFEGNLLDDFNVQQFRVMGSRAFVGGYRHSRPVVLAFSFFDRTTKVLPGLYVNNLELNGLDVDEARQEVNVLVHATRRHCQFTLRTYNYDGKLMRTMDFDGGGNSLISGKLLPINADESLLVGNYSTDCTPYSQGIYVTRVRHGESGRQPADAIRYVEFSQLENFFNYLKPNRQQKLLAKAQRKKEEGKDYRFRYKLLVHDLVPTPDGPLLVAEVYYPQYRGSSSPFGSYLRGPTSVLDGYRYTHAFVCGFDAEGNLRWDNCLPIRELTNPDLTEMVQVSRQGDRMVLAYPNDGQITTAVIQRNRVVHEAETIRLQTGAEHERVTFSAHENVLAWYGRYFLACGFQKIAPPRGTPGPQREREVFYLNKLTYDPSAPRPTAPATTRKNAGSER